MRNRPDFQERFQKFEEIRKNNLDYEFQDPTNEGRKDKTYTCSVKCLKHQTINTFLLSQILEGVFCTQCFLERIQQPDLYTAVESKKDKVKVKFKYTSLIDNWKFVCSEHGEFGKNIFKYLSEEGGCPKCLHQRVPKEEWTFERFQKAAIEKHKGFYTYHKEDFRNKTSKTRITCPLHGDFFQLAESHLDGRGCSKCKSITVAQKKTKTTEEFIKQAQEIHGDKYDYSQTIYKGMNRKISFKCPKHGLVQQTAVGHLSSGGCPFCAESLGERIIRRILEENHIEFFYNKGVFKDLKSEKGGILRPDFYLPAHNLVIEFQGQQHLSEKQMKNLLTFKGVQDLSKQKFQETQQNDLKKKEYFKQKGIKLVEIFSIEKIFPTLKELGFVKQSNLKEEWEEEKKKKREKELEIKEQRRKHNLERDNKRRNRVCLYNGQKILFGTLVHHFYLNKVPHCWSEATKYLLEF